MVERAAAPEISERRRRLLSATRSLTTPLLPDDYLALLDPRWSTREATGRIVEIRPEPDGMATIVIEPLFPWPGHAPGQYLRIGVEIDGIRHWRAYSLTSDPDHPRGLVSITVKRVEGGRVSSYLAGNARPGRQVFLGEIEVMSMIRELARREQLADVVHVHCTRRPEDFAFGEMLQTLSSARPGYRLHAHFSSEQGRLSPADLDELCPDWGSREAFLSGPGSMLDAMSAHWRAQGESERLRVEHFQPFAPDGGAGGLGMGGTIRFRVSGLEAESDGKTPILVAGEQAGGKLAFGCRMGVCHTCICRLDAGRVRDLRTGQVHGSPGEMILACINAPEGPIEIGEGHVVITNTSTRSQK